MIWVCIALYYYIGIECSLLAYKKAMESGKFTAGVSVAGILIMAVIWLPVAFFGAIKGLIAYARRRP